MTTLEQKYKYGLLETIHGSTFITFSNNKKDIKLEPNKRLMYDVTYYIADSILFISGKEDIPIYAHEITYLSELEYQPQKEYIKYNKGKKLFGITFFETHCYVKGWYRTEPIKKVNYIIKNNFNIKEINE